MRRMAILSALLMGLGLISQARCDAGIFSHKDDCSPSCQKCELKKCRTCSLRIDPWFGWHSKKGSGIASQPAPQLPDPTYPTFVHPNRAARDFWMLR